MYYPSHKFMILGRSLVGLALLLISSVYTSFAQVQSVNTVQNLAFGAFSQGASGGTLTISHQGLRSCTGSVVPLSLGYVYHQAIFEIAAPAGTIISILHGPESVISGSNGGSMSLRLESTNPSSPFITTQQDSNLTAVSVGGTLTIGNAQQTPPGTYTGTFYVTFISE